MDFDCKKFMNSCGPDGQNTALIAMLSTFDKLEDLLKETMGPKLCAPTDRAQRARPSPNTPRKSASGPGRCCVRLSPGEVGLRGDRATFHLGPTAADETARRPTGRDLGAGAAYFRVEPDAAERHEARRRAAAVNEARRLAVARRLWAAARAKELQTGVYADVDDDGGYDDGGYDDGYDADADAAAALVAHDDPRWHPKKHVMQVLPPVPATGRPAVGPVTGLPVRDDEHMVVLWLDKRPGEPDRKARLQIEMRMPRCPVTAERDTQSDRPAAEPSVGGAAKKKPAKGKKKNAGREQKAAGGGEKKKAAGGGVKKKAAGGVEKKKAAGGVEKKKAAGGVEKKKAAGGVEKKKIGGGEKTRPVTRRKGPGKKTEA